MSKQSRSGLRPGTRVLLVSCMYSAGPTHDKSLPVGLPRTRGKCIVCSAIGQVLTVSGYKYMSHRYWGHTDKQEIVHFLEENVVRL